MSKKASDVAVVTTNTVAGKTCVPLGPVVAAASANLTEGAGLERAGDFVLRGLAGKAAAQGADAVVGVRMVSSGAYEIQSGSYFTDLIGYGTLVRFSDENDR